MDQFEYKVVPAPTKGQKARGLRRPEEKFAFSIQEIVNEMALDSWEFQRSETLPHEERTGLTGVTTTFRSVLVFRRPKTATQAAPVPETPQVALAPDLPLERIEDHTPELKDVTPETASDVDAEEAEVEDVDDLFSPEKFRSQKHDPNSLPAALRQRATRKRSKKNIAAE